MQPDRSATKNQDSNQARSICFNEPVSDRLDGYPCDVFSVSRPGLYLGREQLMQCHTLGACDPEEAKCATWGEWLRRRNGCTVTHCR
jgi:hypothetical protein